VQVLGLDIIEDFKKKHADAANRLDSWVRVMGACKAKHPIGLKQTFNSVDPVPPQTVFDIGGNNYRLIAKINYRIQLCVITHVLTHQQYDRKGWKE
jgi:mRNA interferase HigB